MIIALLLFAQAGYAATTGLKLSVDDRESTSLTVYEGGFAVVREVKRTVLPLGLVEIDYEGVPRTIDPTSVRVVSLTDPESLTVLEQSFYFNLITRDSLLESFIGQKVKYTLSILQDGTYEKYLREGVLLATRPEVVDFGDEIEIEPEGTISLPYVPDVLRKVPTLVWRLDNNIKGAQRIETRYLLDAIGWNAEYNLTFDEEASTTDIGVWVNLYNRSGGRFDEADLTLVAGQVKRVQANQPVTRRMARTSMASVEMADAGMNVQPESVSEYHAFHMPNPVSLLPNEQTQLHLMSVSGVPVEKRFVLESQVATHQMPESSTDRFDIQLSIENVKRHGLGEALPAGKFRVYGAGTGVPLLLGEDMVAGTPEGEKIEMTIGKAFDLVAERTQKSYRRTSDRTMEISYQIAVRNRREEVATVNLREMFGGNWTIVSQSVTGTRVDSRTQEYVLKLAAGASETLDYTVRIRF
jgi:hypothetical protein